MTRKPQGACKNSDSLASKRRSLNQLKKRNELHTSQAKAYAEDCKNEIEKNNELIRKLRSEISELRIAAKSIPSNEYAMRQTLTDYHTGSSIFREKDPIVVNEQIDYKLSGLQKKLNLLRQARKKKSQHLQRKLEEFNEKVNDVVFLELEGPMGDSRCSAMENYISSNKRKFVEAVILNSTYQNIKDQLAIDSLTYDGIISSIYKLVVKCGTEQSKYEEMASDAKSCSEEAVAAIFKSEVDLRNNRKKNAQTLADLKRETEEQKHEFTRLWKTIHSHLPSQEAMGIYRAMSSLDAGDQTTDEVVHLHDEVMVLQSVTNSLTLPDVVKRFEMQSDTNQQLRAFITELEAKKADFLTRLKDLDVVTSSQTFKSASAEDSALMAASGDYRAACTSPATRWSLLAARNRVTQALSRLRQMLEFLADSFVDAGLISELAQYDTSDTELHLTTLLDAAVRGAAALMAWLDEPQSVQAHSEASRSSLLPAPRESQRRVVLTRDDAVDDDVTGEDTDGNVPTRAAIKQTADVFVQARQKAKGRGKK